MPQIAPEKLRVLLVEENPTDVFLLRDTIERDKAGLFRVAQTADSLARCLELFALGGFDLVLLDLNLPDSRGLETFLRAHEAAPQLPFIVLSEREDEELGMQAVHRGAQDYLVKGGIDVHLLLRAMRYAIERMAAEHELASERDLLQTLLENVPDRIYFKDGASRFLRINRALTELLRLARPEDAYGKTDADFYDAAHAAAAREDEIKVMATGTALLGKVEFEVLADGRRSWSLTTKLPLRNRRGRIIGTCGISREITELKEMEVRLATERNLLRSVIDNVPDHIFLKDLEGRYVLDNAAHWLSLGMDRPEDVIGRTVFDFFPSELAEHFSASDQNILETGHPRLNFEEQTLNVRREPRWMLTTKVPWRGDHGEVIGILYVGRDITAQKNDAEKLRHANAELAASREELLAKMAELQDAHQQLHGMQLQLIEAEKMKSIGRLAAGVAHEVKNPLAVVRMGLEFLRGQTFVDETVGSVLHEMWDAVERADVVIRGLLDFSAPKTLELSHGDLNAIVKHAFQLARGEMRGKIETVSELQPDLPPVPLDRAKIGQVFINLLTNAFHAMNGEGTLTVRTYSKQLTGMGRSMGDRRSESFRVGETLIVAEIENTGPGIPEDQMQKIFEPFFTTKPTGKGTGIGLSVVKTIIDLHGATIDVRNLPEGGVRFTLMFRV
jgi:PAS domain S-box-containing protein